MTQKQKKKQVKITQLFRKHGSAKRFEECDELLEKVKELEKRLQEKHDELFQIQRQNCRKKAVPPKAKPKKITQDKTPIIMLSASVETLKRDMELMSMLTGVEVPDYVPQDHCCVVYHVQRGARVEHYHGLRIDMQSDSKNVSNSNLPLGFNLKAVLEQFDNIMQPKCLGSIRRALVAYYDRLEQYEALKKLLIIDADLFKLLDGSYIEISFIVQSHEEEEEEHQVTLTLEYRVYDITPMIYSFIENDLPENVLEVLSQQCAVFKKKPLHKAFKRAFMDDIGPYRLVRLLGPRREEQRDKRPKLVRPNKKHYNNDDTFHPEECSDQSEDEHLSE